MHVLLNIMLCSLYVCGTVFAVSFSAVLIVATFEVLRGN